MPSKDLESAATTMLQASEDLDPRSVYRNFKVECKLDAILTFVTIGEMGRKLSTVELEVEESFFVSYISSCLL